MRINAAFRPDCDFVRRPTPFNGRGGSQYAKPRPDLTRRQPVPGSNQLRVSLRTDSAFNTSAFHYAPPPHPSSRQSRHASLMNIDHGHGQPRFSYLPHPPSGVFQHPIAQQSGHSLAASETFSNTVLDIVAKPMGVSNNPPLRDFTYPPQGNSSHALPIQFANTVYPGGAPREFGYPPNRARSLGSPAYFISPKPAIPFAGYHSMRLGLDSRPPTPGTAERQKVREYI
jgi:hypothetical protein